MLAERPNGLAAAGWATCLGLLLLALPAVGAESARWFPPGALAHAELTGLGPAIDQLRASSAWNRLVDSPAYQQFFHTREGRRLIALQTVIQRQIGMDLWTAVEQIAGRQLAAALYPSDNPQQPRLVAVARAESAEVLAQLHAQLAPLLELASDHLEQTETLDGGHQVSIQDQVYVAWRDEWLVVATGEDLLEATWQRIGGQGEGALADDAPYQRFQGDGQPLAGASRLLELYANLELLRGQGVTIPERLDQPLFSLLVGDTLARLRLSPYAGVTVDKRPQEMVVRLNMAAAGELPVAHAAYHPPAGKPGASPLPAVPDLVGGVSFYRDFSTWYGQREQLLDAKLLPGFDQFEAGLANILPGKDFAADILPLIGQRMVFVAAPQGYEHLDGRPGIELPGFGLVIELAQPEEGAAIVQLFYQTLTAILNLQAGQQGRDPWIMSTEVYKGVPISVAKYLKKPSGDQLGLVFNFLPSAARVGNHYIVCSSRDLCQHLIDCLEQPGAGQAPGGETFRAAMRIEPLRGLLIRNQDAILGRMMQDGKTAEQAQEEWRLTLGLLGHLDAIGLETIAGEKQHSVQLQWSWK